MKTFREAIQDYLTLRRGLGFKLKKHSRMLEEFASFLEQAGALRKQVKDLQPKATGESLAAIKGLDQKLQALAGGATRRPGAGTEPPTLGGLKTKFLTLFGVFQEADVVPSTQAAAAVTDLQKQLPPLMDRWNALKSQDIPALSKQLKDANLPALKLESAVLPARATVSSKDED